MYKLSNNYLDDNCICVSVELLSSAKLCVVTIFVLLASTRLTSAIAQHIAARAATKICASASKMHMSFYKYATSPRLIYSFQNQAQAFCYLCNNWTYCISRGLVGTLASNNSLEHRDNAKKASNEAFLQFTTIFLFQNTRIQTSVLLLGRRCFVHRK